MKIKSMTATFGKLDKARLELEDGLNILEGPNEGGKSTWAGFLRAMLYGIDTRDRDKKGHLAEKNRYLPWSGAPMSGEITLEWKGRDITIRRSKKGSNPFGAFSAVYAGTEEPVPDMTGDNCGELLTGVNRDVFERSAFIGQNSMGITAVPELEKRVATLVSSGLEDVSCSQTQNRLREWANHRKVNKTVGLIPELEGELAKLRESLSRLERINAGISRTEGERTELLRTLRELEGEKQIHQRIAQRGLNQRFAKAHEEYEIACQAVEKLRQEQARFGELPGKDALKEAQGELQFLKVLDDEIKQAAAALRQAEEVRRQAEEELKTDCFYDLTDAQAQSKAELAVQEYQTNIRSAEKKGKQFVLCQMLGLVLGGGILAAAAAGLVPAQWNFPQMLPYGTGVGVYTVFAAVSLYFSGSKKRCQKAAAEILDQYGVETCEGISALAENYAKRWQNARQCAQEYNQVEQVLEERRERRSKGYTGLLDFVHTFAPEVTDLFGCSAALSRALSLEDRMREYVERAEHKRRHRDDLEAQGGQLMDTLELLHTPARSAQETEADLTVVRGELEQVNRALDRALGEQKAVGDPAELSAKEEALCHTLERREMEHQALLIAMKVLTAANARMQERFSPDLGRTSGRWLSRLTDGKYSMVTLSRELEAAAAEAEGVMPRKALSLSKGTVDQLYLAVRLAVCQLCLPGEERAPLVLDDALVAFDDGRMKLALDCLVEVAGERQVLLFTCQSREGKAMEERKDVAHRYLP